MTKSSVNPGLLIEYRACRREANKLLTAGHYDRVAELLLDFQTTSENHGDTSLAQILRATRRICMACRQYRMETEWRRQAYLETRDREKELQRELQTILDSIAGLETSDVARTRSEAGAACLDEAELSNGPVPFSARAASLVRSVQALLRPGPNLRALRRAKSTESAIGTTEPGIGKDRAPDAPVLTLECQPARLTTPEMKSRPESKARSTLLVYCLGPFQVYQGDHPVEDWPNGKGKSIFKYLITHRDRPVGKEILMDLFWPNAEAHAARNNLNVAIYGLRHAISKASPCQSHVLFRDDCYLLNPDLEIWSDYEDFAQNFAAARALEQRGEEALAMQHYRAAEALYQGEFLEEDRYDDWLMSRRQQLQDDYLCLLDRLYCHHFDRQHYDACTALCGKMLAIDKCHERAHRRLMRCYSKQGQPYLALRQFQCCKTALARELDVMPSKPTLELYGKIRHQEPV